MYFISFFNELDWGKAMVTCSKSQQRKKGEGQMLSGETGRPDQDFDRRLYRAQIVGFRKGTRRQYVP